MPLGCNDCMRLCWLPLTSERSEDRGGIGFVVYELVGKLSRAFSSSAFAARIIAADVLGRVVSVGEPGFMGSGGGARSGSALSHLYTSQSRVEGALCTRRGQDIHGDGPVHGGERGPVVADEIPVQGVFALH